MTERLSSDSAPVDQDDHALDAEQAAGAAAEVSSHELTRRRFLLFMGASAGALMAGSMIPLRAVRADDGAIDFTPIRVPSPLPIHTERDSFLPTGLGAGDIVGPTGNGSDLTDYTVIDDVVVPPEYERYVIVKWGDRPFRDRDQYVGNNHDYTGFVSLGRSGGDDDDDDGSRRDPREGLLWVNHEYNSFPFSDLAPGVPSSLAGFDESFPSTTGFSLPNAANAGGGGQTALTDAERKLLLGEMHYNIGGSVLHVRKRRRSGRWSVVDRSRRNRRITGMDGLAINADRTDGYETVTSWGSVDSHQEGNDDYLVATGPAAEVFETANSDGLGNRIIGTGFNCSGATTPWGTVLTAEENFQGSSFFYIGVQEQVRPDGTQVSYVPGTSGELFGLVGEKYGYMVEIDLKNGRRRPRKHSALGRFRHENVALRAERGEQLVCYLGDDRRGGHTWKYVSDGRVRNPSSRRNSRLLEQGTLYVAKFNSDGTGEWIPLVASTPTNPNRPTDLVSVVTGAGVTPDDDGNTFLPRRNGIGDQTEDGGRLEITVSNQDSLLSDGVTTLIEDYEGRLLGEFYDSQGAILIDAFLAANLIGGTPGARPEDIEVHPKTKEVFIAYTDGLSGSDGYPDSRIFQTAKLAADVDATQPQGGIYKIVEDLRDGSGTTFRWSTFAQGGEAGTETGAGFAQADNMLFDQRGNLWVVTDMSTSRHNGFSTGATPSERTITHSTTGGDAAASQVDKLPGVYGNNWLFVTPTRGPDAGKIVPFAYGPTRCEMTGPTLIGEQLILAVQHPGEDNPIADGTQLSRTIEMLDLDGGLFDQARTVSLGSNFPSNIEGDPDGVPRSCVIAIQRIDDRSGGDDDDGGRRRGDDDDD